MNFAKPEASDELVVYNLINLIMTPNVWGFNGFSFVLDYLHGLPGEAVARDGS